jgi:NADH-quinone oxidoreductase subunit M
MHALLITLWAPLVGALLIILLPERHQRLIKGVAVAHAAAALGISWGMLFQFDKGSAGLQFAEAIPWLSDPSAALIGVDGLSFPMVLLTTLLAAVAVVASLGVERRVKAYFAWFLLLEFAILGVFEAQSFSLFYVFWELTLIPLFFLINIWGGENRGAASMSFLLYTLAGSIFMLVALIALVVASPDHSFAMASLARRGPALSRELQTIIFVGLFIGLAVKIPVFPLHGWLPLAYVEAPTPVSIMLSAVLAKMGGYGLMRVTGIVPLGALSLQPLLFAGALVSILYGAMLAWRQTDMKAMVAYSSVNHMGFVLLGVASLNTSGFVGATMQMVTHGIITGALFLLVGALYERTHTRDLTQLGGLASVVPKTAAAMSLAILASMGLPGLAGFVSELHTLVGGFERSRLLVGLVSVGVLITASYSLRAVSRIFLGPVNPRWTLLGDLSRREIIAVAPLAALMVGLGVAPDALLGLMRATIAQMASIF